MSGIGPLNILDLTSGTFIVTRLNGIPGAWLHDPYGLCLRVVCMSESAARSRAQCTIANSALVVGASKEDRLGTWTDCARAHMWSLDRMYCMESKAGWVAWGH